jgi:hypothetical protein
MRAQLSGYTANQIGLALHSASASQRGVNRTEDESDLWS